MRRYGKGKADRALVVSSELAVLGIMLLAGEAARFAPQMLALATATGAWLVAHHAAEAVRPPSRATCRMRQDIAVGVLYFGIAVSFLATPIWSRNLFSAFLATLLVVSTWGFSASKLRAAWRANCMAAAVTVDG